ncbi:hypothetical protein H0H93_015348 [Arthromyces matolae]|nr:hypothetical protein H0H93_015348 [Arthromyces matolae]
MSTSSKLVELYDALPPDAQRRILETHLIPLLDALPEEVTSSVLSATKEAESRSRRMPNLDLKGKKKEVNGLMDALNLDSKLFVTMLGHGSSAAKGRINEMIDDIELMLGWESLERLLFGGKSLDDIDDDDFDEDDEEEEEFPEDDLDCIDEDGDEDYVDEDTCHGLFGPCFHHAAHWPESLDKHRIRLREIIEERLHAHFRRMPSIQMFNVIRAISGDPSNADRVLLQETSDNATKSSDTFAAALAIYASKVNAFRIYSLLDTHSHLLRPKDSDVLQFAVRVLVGSGYSGRGLQILEREIMEITRAIHAALLAVFGFIEMEEHKLDVERILKLRAGTQERKERIQNWVDAVNTHVSPMNPMAFAAMMMGLPVGGPVEDGGHEDPAAVLDDVDDTDPDWEDLKEELTEFQGKTHIARALQTLSNFCILHRKKIVTANKQRRAEKGKEKDNKGKEQGKASSASASTPVPAPAPPTSSGPSFPFSFHAEADTRPPPPSLSGMEDVD